MAPPLFIRRPDLRPPRPPHAAKEAGRPARPPTNAPRALRREPQRAQTPLAAGQRLRGRELRSRLPRPLPRMAPWRGAELAPAAAPAGQQYFRSDSSDSAAYMLGNPSGSEGEPPARPEKRRRRKRCSPVWLAVAAMGIVALQIASATGLFVYFTMSIAKVGRGGRSGRPSSKQRRAGGAGATADPSLREEAPGRPFAWPRGGGGGVTGSGRKCSAADDNKNGRGRGIWSPSCRRGWCTGGGGFEFRFCPESFGASVLQKHLELRLTSRYMAEGGGLPRTSCQSNCGLLSISGKAFAEALRALLIPLSQGQPGMA